MSSGEGRKVTPQDIQLVQNMIEHCLQLYMNQKEVINTLLHEAKIEPDFTELVWEKLKEENQEFFKAYHVRLLLKNQILVFNKLLQQQVDVMHQIYATRVNSVSLSNGSGSFIMQQTPHYLSNHVPTSLRHDDLYINGGSPSANVLSNGATLGNQGFQVSNNGIDGALPIMTNGATLRNQGIQLSNTGINGTLPKSQNGYSNDLDYNFCTSTSFLDPHAPLGVEPGHASFSYPELDSTLLNNLQIDFDESTFALNDHLTRTFSFPDLDFTQSADILENYGRSPFLPNEGNDFLDSLAKDSREHRTQDTILEGSRKDDFRSD